MQSQAGQTFGAHLLLIKDNNPNFCYYTNSLRKQYVKILNFVALHFLVECQFGSKSVAIFIIDQLLRGLLR